MATLGNIIWNGDKVLKEFDKKADKKLLGLAITVQGNAKRAMQQTKTTRKKGSRNPVSLPWNAPAIQTGQLVSDINYGHVKMLHYRVGTGSKYGLWLEVGVPENNLYPRPWLRPALYSLKKI